MRTVLASIVLCLFQALPALAQATSEWRTAHGLPVAVVEVPGGDVEAFAAALPVDASPPAAVAGFPATLTPQRGVLLWSVRVPALLAQPALVEFIRTLATTGTAAVVLLGPSPARELRETLAALEDVPARPLPRLPCVLEDGVVEVRRGAPERVDLAFAVPGPQDPRYDLLPALAALLRIRLRTTFPDLRIETELAGGCARLHLEVPAGTEGARLLLGRVRSRLAAALTSPPTADEAAKAVAACDNRAARVAVAGRAIAEELVQRLALGGGVAGALASPALDPAALAELARQVLAGHAGVATVVEQERRAQDEPPKTLDNGAVLSLRWFPSQFGVMGIALGGVDPRAGRTLLATAADHAAGQGWSAAVGDILGVPTLAVAAPAAAVVAMMEQVSDAFTAPQPPAPDDLAAEVARAEGLAEHVAAESVSVALALPPEVDEGPEAGRKFFGGLQGGGVRTGATLPTSGLAWTVREGEPAVVGAVDLATTTAGLVAGQVIRDRLDGQTGIHTAVLAPAGRVVLTVAAEGGAHVPAVDAWLVALWNGARRPCTPAELTTATHRLVADLYGDAAQATARAAASAFVPQLPTVASLLSAEAGQVSAFLARLPGWEQLPRFARGRAPEVVVPRRHGRGVRKSSPRS
jgi:hypothetical protein